MNNVTNIDDYKNFVNSIKLHPTEYHQWVAKAQQVNLLKVSNIHNAILLKQKFEYIPDKANCRLYTVYDVPHMGRIILSTLMDVSGDNYGDSPRSTDRWFNKVETIGLYCEERSKYRNLYCRFGERDANGEIIFTDGLCDNDKFFAGEVFRNYLIATGMVVPDKLYA